MISNFTNFRYGLTFLIGKLFSVILRIQNSSEFQLFQLWDFWCWIRTDQGSQQLIFCEHLASRRRIIWLQNILILNFLLIRLDKLFVKDLLSCPLIVFGRLLRFHFALDFSELTFANHHLFCDHFACACLSYHVSGANTYAESTLWCRFWIQRLQMWLWFWVSASSGSEVSGILLLVHVGACGQC